MQKRHRLADRAAFAQVVKGRKLYSKRFLARFQPNACGYLRIAISVGKHNFKLAVDRNRVKRQVRTFVDAIPDLGALPYDVLLVVNKAYTTAAYAENRNEFLALLARLNRTAKHQTKPDNGRQTQPRRNHDL